LLGISIVAIPSRTRTWIGFGLNAKADMKGDIMPIRGVAIPPVYGLDEGPPVIGVCRPIMGLVGRPGAPMRPPFAKGTPGVKDAPGVSGEGGKEDRSPVTVRGRLGRPSAKLAMSMLDLWPDMGFMGSDRVSNVRCMSA
jgi:hypothetical protein